MERSDVSVIARFDAYVNGVDDCFSTDVDVDGVDRRSTDFNTDVNGVDRRSTDCFSTDVDAGVTDGVDRSTDNLDVDDVDRSTHGRSTDLDVDGVDRSTHGVRSDNLDVDDLDGVDRSTHGVRSTDNLDVDADNLDVDGVDRSTDKRESIDKRFTAEVADELDKLDRFGVVFCVSVGSTDELDRFESTDELDRFGVRFCVSVGSTDERFGAVESDELDRFGVVKRFCVSVGSTGAVESDDRFGVVGAVESDELDRFGIVKRFCVSGSTGAVESDELDRFGVVKRFSVGSTDERFGAVKRFGVSVGSTDERFGGTVESDELDRFGVVKRFGVSIKSTDERFGVSTDVGSTELDRCFGATDKLDRFGVVESTRFGFGALSMDSTRFGGAEEAFGADVDETDERFDVDETDERFDTESTDERADIYERFGADVKELDDSKLELELFGEVDVGVELGEVDVEPEVLFGIVFGVDVDADVHDSDEDGTDDSDELFGTNRFNGDVDGLSEKRFGAEGDDERFERLELDAERSHFSFFDVDGTGDSADRFSIDEDAGDGSVVESATAASRSTDFTVGVFLLPRARDLVVLDAGFRRERFDSVFMSLSANCKAAFAISLSCCLIVRWSSTMWSPVRSASKVCRFSSTVKSVEVSVSSVERF